VLALDDGLAGAPDRMLVKSPNPLRCYPWDDGLDPDLSNYLDTGFGTTSAVGCFPDGVSPYWVEELSGNVWEWCTTKWQMSYVGYGDDTDVKGDASRVLRGGSFALDPRHVRCARRLGSIPDRRHREVGFRVVVSPGPA